MKISNITVLISVIPLLSGLTFAGLHAQTTEVLKEITETADKLCVDVAQSGHETTTEIRGDVTAELSGLARRLAKLGISGSGAINDKEYNGILQDQLAESLKDVRKCKIAIFNTLQNKLLVGLPQPVVRDPNAFYQYGERVADVQGAVISQGNGIVTFQTIHTSGKADKAHEVEYQNWVLSCPDLPSPHPNAIIGQYSGMVVGEKCMIVRKLTSE